MTFRYGIAPAVLENFSWKVPSGRTALLGPNGAGKSTLMGILAGALRPRKGQVTAGRTAWPGRDGREYRRHVGWMPQDDETVPHLSVRENVEFFAWLKGMPARTARDASGPAIESVRLSELSDKKARTLSGGQRRRLCLAQTLVTSPQLLLLDEPSVGLDPTQREGFRRVLNDLAETDVVVSTHLVDEVDEGFDTVVVMDSGAIVFSGPVAEFLTLVPEGERRGERAYRLLVPDIFA